MADENEKTQDSFVSGSMAGAETTQQAPSKRPAREAPEVPYRSRDTERPAPKYVPEPRGPMDPNAVVEHTDSWNRPLERHAGYTWETNAGVTRRFTLGQELWLCPRKHIAVSEDEVKSQGLDTLADKYMRAHNDAGWLASLHETMMVSPEAAKAAGTDPLYNTGSYIPSCTARVKIVDSDPPGNPVSIGLCPVYEVQVVSGPATGLRLLAWPSDIMDDDNLDGYGIDRMRRRKQEGFPIPPGFTIK